MEPKKPEAGPRPKYESIGQIMDTKSFVLPTSKRIVWMWVAISAVLPVLMWITFALCKRYWH